MPEPLTDEQLRAIIASDPHDREAALARELVRLRAELDVSERMRAVAVGHERALEAALAESEERSRVHLALRVKADMRAGLESAPKATEADEARARAILGAPADGARQYGMLNVDELAGAIADERGRLCGVLVRRGNDIALRAAERKRAGEPALSYGPISLANLLAEIAASLQGTEVAP